MLTQSLFQLSYSQPSDVGPKLPQPSVMLISVSQIESCDHVVHTCDLPYFPSRIPPSSSSLPACHKDPAKEDSSPKNVYITFDIPNHTMSHDIFRHTLVRIILGIALLMSHDMYRLTLARITLATASSCKYCLAYTDSLWLRSH